MSTILVTGANKGIGFATARQLVAAGHVVYVGSRDAARGRRAAEQIGARAVQLDVTDDASVAAAADAIAADGGLDVLVNNAAIQVELGGDGAVIGAAGVTPHLMRETLDTNVIGMVRVLHAFLPQLRRSAAPVVVNVSSGAASLTRLSDPDSPSYAYDGVAYPVSKAAVNVITVQFAKAFPAMRINAVEPGSTNTDINPTGRGRQTPDQGARIIVRMAQLGPDGPTGGYFEADGPIPW